MATRRTAAHVHPSRRDNVPREENESRRRKRPPKPVQSSTASGFTKPHAINELKSQARSLRRLLAHRGEDGRLPATVRMEKERALRTAEEELARAARRKDRSACIGRWHKVRFFDRRRAEKRLKRAKRELGEAVAREDGDAAAADVEDLRRRVHEAEVDVKYAIYYPLERDYVSLFPTRRAGTKKKKVEEEKEEDDDAEAGKEVEREGDPVMWELVRKCMAEGKLNDLRDGKLGDAAAVGPSQDEDVDVAGGRAGRQSGTRRATKDTAAKKESGRAAESGDGGNDDDDSDGGFFE